MSITCSRKKFTAGRSKGRMKTGFKKTCYCSGAQSIHTLEKNFTLGKFLGSRSDLKKILLCSKPSRTGHLHLLHYDLCLLRCICRNIEWGRWHLWGFLHFFLNGLIYLFLNHLFLNRLLRRLINPLLVNRLLRRLINQLLRRLLLRLLRLLRCSILLHFICELAYFIHCVLKLVHASGRGYGHGPSSETSNGVRNCPKRSVPEMA